MEEEKEAEEEGEDDESSPYIIKFAIGILYHTFDPAFLDAIHVWASAIIIWSIPLLYHVFDHFDQLDINRIKIPHGCDIPEPKLLRLLSQRV